MRCRRLPLRVRGVVIVLWSRYKKYVWWYRLSGARGRCSVSGDGVGNGALIAGPLA